MGLHAPLDLVSLDLLRPMPTKATDLKIGKTLRCPMRHTKTWVPSHRHRPSKPTHRKPESVDSSQNRTSNSWNQSSATPAATLSSGVVSSPRSPKNGSSWAQKPTGSALPPSSTHTYSSTSLVHSSAAKTLSTMTSGTRKSTNGKRTKCRSLNPKLTVLLDLRNNLTVSLWFKNREKSISNSLWTLST